MLKSIDYLVAIDGLRLTVEARVDRRFDVGDVVELGFNPANILPYEREGRLTGSPLAARSGASAIENQVSPRFGYGS
jgi:hypothetical protein